MSQIDLLKQDPADWGTPATGYTAVGINENGVLTTKQHDGTETVYSNSADVAALEVELDAHIADVNNPHETTAAQVGAQPLDADLTAYANAADATARRVLISAAKNDLSNAEAVAALATRIPNEGLWIFPSWSTSGTRLELLISGDGINWRLLQTDLYSPAADTLRDPSICPKTVDGWWYLAFTNVNNSTYVGNTMRVIRSRDLINWTAYANIVATGRTYAWSPEWFIDTDGSVKIFFAAGDNGTTDFKIYYASPTSSTDFSAWSTPVVAFDGVNAIDPFVVKDGSTYYLTYKNETTKATEIASATTAAGPYTRIGVLNPSWAAEYEGVSVHRMPSGWRIYADKYTGSNLGFQYAESASLTSGWGAFTAITFNTPTLWTVRHGTPLFVTADMARSALVASALSTNFTRGLITKGGGGVTDSGMVCPDPVMISETSAGSWAQFQLYHVGGSGTHKAITELVSNDTWQGFQGITATGGTFLWNCNIATKAMTWYGDWEVDGVFKAGSLSRDITDTFGNVLVGPASTSAVSGSAPSILSAAPTLVNNQKPFKLIADGFVYFADDYNCTRDGYSGVLPTIANGYASFAVSGYIQCIIPASPRTSFHSAQVDVVGRAASGAKLESIGLCKTGAEFTDWLLCYYDGTNIKLESKVGGVGTTYTGVAVALTTYKLAISQTQNIVAAWYDSGNGWVLAGSWDVSGSRDFTAVDLTTWKYFYYLGGTGSVLLKNFRCGFFGETGRSSFYEITYEDGTPIWEGRWKYFAVAVAGLDTSASDADFTTAHTAVYKINVDTFEAVCASKILIRRISRTLGDSYGPIIFDRESNTWNFFPQTTGNFFPGNSVVLRCTSKASLLSGVHILDGSTTFPLAANGVDPFWDLSIRKIGATWYAAYSTQYPNFRPTLDTATSLAGPWTRVSRDTTRVREGSRIVNWFGTNYILYADATVIDVYDLTLTHLGTVSITSAGWSFSTPSSHPMLFPIPQPDGTTKYRWITHSSGAAARPFTGWSSCYGTTLFLDVVGSRTGFVVSPDIL